MGPGRRLGAFSGHGRREHHGTVGSSPEALCPFAAKGPARSPRGVRRDTVRHEGGPWGPRSEARPGKGRGRSRSPSCHSASRYTPSSLGWDVRVSGHGPSSFPALRPAGFQLRRRDDGSVRNLASTGPDDGGGEPLATGEPGHRAGPVQGRRHHCRRPGTVPGERSPCGMTIATLLLALIATPSGDATGEPLLLDFHASWCGPCQQMRPAIETLIQKGYQVKSVDVDQSPDLAARYQVQNVPTFIVVDAAGEPLARTMGPQPAGQLAQMYLAAKAKLKPRPDRKRAAREPSATRRRRPRRTSRPTTAPPAPPPTPIPGRPSSASRSRGRVRSASARARSSPARPRSRSS